MSPILGSRFLLASALCVALAGSAAADQGIWITQVNAPASAVRSPIMAADMVPALPGLTMDLLDPTGQTKLASRNARGENIQLLTYGPSEVAGRIQQVGTGNMMVAAFAGRHNEANLSQTGAQNGIGLFQGGTDNVLSAAQAGTGNSATLTQSGDRLSLTATQTGTGNMMALQQGGTGGVITAVQSGGGNQLGAVQAGAGNRLSAVQR
jgi:hypothetical protein